MMGVVASEDRNKVIYKQTLNILQINLQNMAPRIPTYKNIPKDVTTSLDKNNIVNSVDKVIVKNIRKYLQKIVDLQNCILSHA